MKANSFLLAAALVLGAQGMPHAQGPKATAMIVVTSGEEQKFCQFGNINVAWVAIIRADIIRNPNLDSRHDRRYISSLDETAANKHCVILPITVPIGTPITVSGLIEDRGSTDGLSPTRMQPTVTEQCFNVEAYSIGLTDDDPANELNPLDPTNIINDQGFGLFWAMTDLPMGRTFTFDVTGCGAGLKCHRPTTVYNTDTGLTNSTGCVVLAPLS
jgi:hypothetical protein